MAFGFVQGFGASATTLTGEHASTTATMAFASNNAANNMLVAFIGSWDTPSGRSVSSITDTAGNTWSTANRIATVSSYDSETRVELWWIPTCLGGANTVTVNFPTGTMYKDCYVAEYSGAGGAVLDAYVFGTDYANTFDHSSGNTAAVGAGDLVLGFYCDTATSSTPSVTDGKTSRATPSGALTCIVSDSLASVADEQSATFHTTVTYFGLSLCACFKGTARAAPIVTMAASS